MSKQDRGAPARPPWLPEEDDRRGGKRLFGRARKKDSAEDATEVKPSESPSLGAAPPVQPPVGDSLSSSPAKNYYVPTRKDLDEIPAADARVMPTLPPPEPPRIVTPEPSLPEMKPAPRPIRSMGLDVAPPAEPVVAETPEAPAKSETPDVAEIVKEPEDLPVAEPETAEAAEKTEVKEPAEAPAPSESVEAEEKAEESAPSRPEAATAASADPFSRFSELEAKLRQSGLDHRISIDDRGPVTPPVYPMSDFIPPELVAKKAEERRAAHRAEPAAVETTPAEPVAVETVLVEDEAIADAEPQPDPVAVAAEVPAPEGDDESRDAGGAEARAAALLQRIESQRTQLNEEIAAFGESEVVSESPAEPHEPESVEHQAPARADDDEPVAKDDSSDPVEVVDSGVPAPAESKSEPEVTEPEAVVEDVPAEPEAADAEPEVESIAEPAADSEPDAAEAEPESEPAAEPEPEAEATPDPAPEPDPVPAAAPQPEPAPEPVRTEAPAPLVVSEPAHVEQRPAPIAPPVAAPAPVQPVAPISQPAAQAFPAQQPPPPPPPAGQGQWQWVPQQGAAGAQPAHPAQPNPSPGWGAATPQQHNYQRPQSYQAPPSLDDAAVINRRRNAPRAGWRRAMHQLSGGHINPGESRKVRERDELLAMIRQPILGDYRIAVLSIKGGVGKTTTTLGLGSAFATVRTDRILAFDANPDRGTLAERVRDQSTHSTVRDLLNDQHINSYADVRNHTRMATSRLEVLASEQDPAVSEAFGEVDYRRAIEILQRYYNIILTDCGTGIMHSAMKGVLDLAHTIVLVSSPAMDAARSASATLDWLTQHGYSNLVREGHVVLSASRPGTAGIKLEKVYEHFSARCKSIHMVPFDPHLAEGADVDFSVLSPATNEAYLQLAAAIAVGFPRPQARGDRRW